MGFFWRQSYASHFPSGYFPCQFFHQFPYQWKILWDGRGAGKLRVQREKAGKGCEGWQENFKISGKSRRCRESSKVCRRERRKESSLVNESNGALPSMKSKSVLRLIVISSMMPLVFRIIFLVPSFSLSP